MLPPIVARPIRGALERGGWLGGVEWEYRPRGWPDSDPRIRGWNDESVVTTQLARWPQFIRSVGGTAPFRLSNEAASPREGDYGFHNTVVTFGYVLTRAALGHTRLSVLDWGGGIGHYCIYARALVPEVQLEYHCRDLPLLAAGGRQVLPDATFHDSDETIIARTYDLVVASGSLHFSRDWRATLATLASVTGKYLYVTRQPLVKTAPSFVVVQRADRHAYFTKYAGWFLNRTEFLTSARSLGLELVREFLIAERPVVARAPEQADYRGFLFRTPER